MNINIVTYLITGALVISAVIKNYHYEKFYSIVDNNPLNFFDLIRRIIGSRYTGLVWIIPYRIEKQTSNNTATIHKAKFNSWAKIFIVFWSLTIIWVLFVYVLKK